MEVTHRIDRDTQKRKLLRKQKIRKTMVVVTVTGLVVGIVLGSFLGSIGKKKLEAEVAALTSQVNNTEQEMADVKGELQDAKDREAIDEGELELPWNLTLVNKWNEMEAGYEPPELTEVAEDMFVDSRNFAHIINL